MALEILANMQTQESVLISLTSLSCLKQTYPNPHCRRPENKTHFLLDGLGILRHVSVTATHTSSPGINVYQEYSIGSVLNTGMLQVSMTVIICC